jgi:hypothetical protein
MLTTVLNSIIIVIDICDKAAREKGKDIQADIDCVKYSAATKTDCWPCLCDIAKAGNYNIKGC